MGSKEARAALAPAAPAKPRRQVRAVVMARSKTKRPSTDAARNADLPQTDWQGVGRDWQEVGRNLWARFIYHLDQCRPLEARERQIQRQRRQIQRQILAAHRDLIVAGWGGDVLSFMLWLLKSRPELIRCDRDMDWFIDRILIDLLEDFFNASKPIKKPRWARICASLAVSFYQRWKDANRRNGINDWGHRGEMKDEACRLVIELRKKNAPTFEQVRELMERPAKRREC
jgi:hypothetical protein